MRTIFVVLILGATLAVRAGEIAVPSTVRAATVFRDRAQVERQGSVQIARGENAIVFHELTNELVDESVRVGGEGTADAEIIDVNVEPEFPDESASMEVKTLQVRMDSLNDEMRRLNDRLGVLATQREFILAMKTPPPAGAAGQRMNVKEFQDLMQYVTKALAEIADGTREIDVKKARLHEKIDATSKRLNELRSQANKNLKRITVHVNGRKAGNLNLSLSYDVTHASWEPLYDARAMTATGNIAWTYYGTVQQETGENWNNVKLTLSTAVPSRGAHLPELSAWFLQQYEPRPIMYNAVGASGMRLESRSSADAAAPSSILQMNSDDDIHGVQHAMVTADETILATTFAIEAAMTIPSDGHPHKALIQSASLNAKLEHVAVPRVMRDVFLRAKAVNNTGVPFLSGNVNVFVDNQFVSTTTIPILVPGDSLELALGANDAIKTERRLVSKVQEYNGLISRTFKWNYEYVTTITSNAKSDVAIELQDQLPLSQNEKIVIETQRIVPPADGKSDANVLTWRLVLKPGEKKEIRMKYSVEYPRDMRVAGME